jgi:hypothetical protein
MLADRLYIPAGADVEGFGAVNTHEVFESAVACE